MQKINQEKVFIERALQDYNELTQKVDDGLVLLEMAVDAQDEASFLEVKGEMQLIRALTI